jgi:hypothetical protein
MAGASSDGEMNYWPGFVDALANLVLALVFVVVIFTLALAVIASQVTKRAASAATEAAKSAAAAQLEADKGQAAELLKEIDALKSTLIEKDKLLNLQASSSVREAPAPESKSVAASSADLTINFEPGAYQIAGDALAGLDTLMKAKGSNPGSKTFEIVAYPGAGGFSAEKRSAYYRLVNMRNLLIERGVPAANIKTRTAIDNVLPTLQGQVRLNVKGK